MLLNLGRWMANMQCEKVEIQLTEDRDVDPTEAEILWNALPRLCPITGLRLYMIVEHLTRGIVPVYGEPGQLQTIPYNQDGELLVDYWDHGERTWRIGYPIGSVELGI